MPPPVTVEGIDAYRDTWPAFFQWQREHGGSFDIAALRVTAGADVAFAAAVLRCASKDERERDDTPRLRLSIGLRKEDGRWQIAHEHHSYPLDPQAVANVGGELNGCGVARPPACRASARIKIAMKRGPSSR